MQYEIDYNQMPDHVLITTHGQAEVVGFSFLLKELTESPQWLKGTKQLVDHRNLELSHFRPEAIQMAQDIVRLFTQSWRLLRDWRSNDKLVAYPPPPLHNCHLLMPIHNQADLVSSSQARPARVYGFFFSVAPPWHAFGNYP